MRRISVFPVLALVVFASCGKAAKQVLTGCRITQIKATGVLPQGTTLDVYRLQYRDIGSLETVEITSRVNGVATETVRRFSYGKGYVVIDHYNGNPGVLAYRDSLVLDKDNRIVYVYTTQNRTTMAILQTMEYDAAGQLIKIGADFQGEWANGDLISQGKGLYKTALAYYDTVYNVGAIKASYDDLINYGGPLKKRTRLLKTATNSQIVYDYFYQLDKDGKIEKWEERSRDGQYTGTYEYTYNCL